jgi:ABC-type dipeptide/oligopeptide/nickel transport system ATPase component
MRIAALIGEPASGKSTLAREILRVLGPPTMDIPSKLVKGTIHGPTYVIGLYPPEETFGGTDRLSMAVQPQAQEFIYGLRSTGSRVFFEGDRLGNISFLNFIRECGRLRVFVLQASETTKTYRHLLRGDTQKEKFLKGRKTKIANILKAFPRAEILQNEDLRDLSLNRTRIMRYLDGGE